MKKKLCELLLLNSYHKLTLELPCSIQILKVNGISKLAVGSNKSYTYCPEVFDKMSMGTPTICSEVTKLLQGKSSR